MRVKIINHRLISNPLKGLILSLILGLGSLFFSLSAFAQACCSGGVPLGGSLGLGAAEGKTLQLLVTYDYNAMNDLMDGSASLADQTRSRATHSTILEMNYGLTHRLSVTGVLPFVTQTRTIESFNGRTDFTSTSGIGDPLFLVKYRVLDPVKYFTTDFVIGAGPKFPVARTDLRNNLGLALPADMQPGSGSLDGIFWSSFRKGRFLDLNFGWTAVGVFRYSGMNNNYNNSQTYRFGNEFQLSMGPDYTFFVNDLPFNVYAFLRFREQGADLIDGNIFPSSGGQWVYAITGFNFQFTPRWALRLSGTLPLHRAVEGTQLTTSHKLKMAVQFNIPFNNNRSVEVRY